MMTNSLQSATALLCATAATACSPSRPQTSSAREGIPAALSSTHRLSTGARLDPAGRSIGVGNMPLGALAARDGRFLVLSLGGWREQGLEVVDVARGTVVQRLPQAGAYRGLAWSADGSTLYASGGATDEVYVYAWHGGDKASATLIDSIGLRSDTASAIGSRYPAGIAVSRDGRTLYVAENLSDSLAIVDVATRRVVRRVGTGLYPYAVAVGADERVYVSDWGAWTVHVYRPTADAHSLIAERPIDVGRHPSAIVLNADGTRLFVTSASTDRVAAVDTRARRVVRWLL